MNVKKMNWQWLGLLAIMFVIGTVGVKLFSQQRFSSIVVHHSATLNGNFQTIQQAHRKRGWVDTAYHLVMANGRGDQAAGTLESGFRYRWLFYSPATGNAACNLGALHLCVIGNFETEPVTDQLSSGLGHALTLLQARYGIPDDGIRLHRDCNRTACPGRGINRELLATWRATDSQSVDPEVARQQLRVIKGGAFGWWQAMILSGSFIFGLPLVSSGVRWLLANLRRKAKADPQG